MLTALQNFRRWRIAGLLGALLFFLPMIAFAGGSPVGVWKSVDDETNEAKAHIEIYEKNGQLFGKIIKLLKKPGAKCTKCEGADKNKPIEGMRILWGMSKDGSEWEGGRIFDPEKGKSYRCKLWLGKDGRLNVRGYLGLFFRTQKWLRIR